MPTARSASIPDTAFDYLAAEESAVETFTYRIVNSAGASEPITVTLNIEGANDAATLGGVSTGEVSEDGEVTTASGAISVTDADAGQAELANPGTRQGTYGSLTLAADGTWTYTIDNSLLGTQALGAEDTATEAFDISSADGTAASSISISVNGTNDDASIAGDPDRYRNRGFAGTRSGRGIRCGQPHSDRASHRRRHRQWRGRCWQSGNV